MSTVTHEEPEFTPGPIGRFLAADHVRLEALLSRATANPAEVDLTAYTEFRAGLLRHIGMEEKILLPAARWARAGQPLPAAARLRLDHGAIASLLVPTPTPAIIGALRTILAAHNLVEEGSGGVYDLCEQLAGDTTEALLSRLRAAPEVPLNPHLDTPVVAGAIRRALQRAGYDPQALGL